MLQTLEINFLDKGMLWGGGDSSTAGPGAAGHGQAGGAGADRGTEAAEEEDEASCGSRRRLLRSAVEKWLAPRAKAVRRLLLMWVVGRRGALGWWANTASSPGCGPACALHALPPLTAVGF